MVNWETRCPKSPDGLHCDWGRWCGLCGNSDELPAHAEDCLVPSLLAKYTVETP